MPACNGSDGRVAGRDRAILLYDRDCRFCRWSLDRVLQWDRGERLRALALQEPEADRVLVDVDPPSRMDSWHLVTPGGDVHSGGRATAPLLRLLPGGSPLAWLADAFPGLTDRAYAFVAGHRALLSRLIGRWAGS